MNIDNFDLDANELVAIEQKLSDLLSAKHNKSLKVHFRNFSFELSEEPAPAPMEAMAAMSADGPSGGPSVMIECVRFYNPLTRRYECRKK